MRVIDNILIKIGNLTQDDVNIYRTETILIILTRVTIVIALVGHLITKGF